MKATVWKGIQKLEVQEVPDPTILNQGDCIVRITSTAICGSDLHLYNGFLPMMEPGDILGHEFMGEVVEVGKGNKKLKVGDRVVVPFTICCGECEQCRRGNFSVCERSNRKADLAAKMFGYTTAGLFGYSHLTGGYPGGQAEYVRVPFADVTPIKIPSGLSDEQVLFLGDIFTTGWQAAVVCDIQPTDVVAVWGCGPVGQFCIRSAQILGAGRVIAIDSVPERLDLARSIGAETIDHTADDVHESLKVLTGGKGPDKCIDAVGAEAHGEGTLGHLYDKVKAATMLETDRPYAFRQAIMACRPAGIVSVPGVYGGLADKIPLGALMNKGLTIFTGQTHVNRYAEDLLRRIEEGQIDPSFVITHRAGLEQGPELYKMFLDKQDGCIKVVLRP
jgi:threonine dehydrogenase-like Zn-dependent dehydrogenase